MLNKLKSVISEILKNRSIFFECGYHMHININESFVTYKGRVIKHHDFNYWKEANTMQELYQRCLHIESLGLKANIHNVAREWEDYKNLQPGIPTLTAYPWVSDDYYESRNVWRPISQKQYERHLNVVPPITMVRGGFIQGEAITYDSKRETIYLACREQSGRYYAKLTNLNNFYTEMKQKINQQ
ncbi:hypothetical protein CAL7716_102330 (plasmid) [Calothrix sp. PCC 7716]|nr:hypothetical protein CAL7716_102330 [Calothrix sp. PCC 7716]